MPASRETSPAKRLEALTNQRRDLSSISDTNILCTSHWMLFKELKTDGHHLGFRHVDFITD